MDFENLDEEWDLIVVGGGITGAGILRESIRSGLKVLLVEQRDFAWGTSSRSSKLVHGGLRYLKEGKIFLTRESVIERQRLIREAPGLVDALGFLTPVYSGQSPGRILLEIGLTIYSLLAWERQHSYYSRTIFKSIVPFVNDEDLTGGFRFLDGQVDDARLVMRVLNESLALGGFASNYTRATRVNRDESGNVSGVTVENSLTGETKNLKTKAIINASGAWAEMIHKSPQSDLHIRPLRGSHLIFPAETIPITQAVSYMHPTDGRPVFALPWEGTVMVGTTDVDHDRDMLEEPGISKEEAKYLMDGVQALFPSHNISYSDCVATISGVRPVLSRGQGKDPSKESREHTLWIEKGLVTITGGKLTTFRRLAWDALKAAKPFLDIPKLIGEGDRVFTQVPARKPDNDYGLSPETWKRLYGRYAMEAEVIVKSSPPEDLATIPGTHCIWAELPHAAKNEQVRRLSDLLLRRVRIGMLTREGGKEHLDRVRKLCQPVLPWDDEKWEQEIEAYLDIIKKCYSPPSLD